mgnify:FL=1
MDIILIIILILIISLVLVFFMGNIMIIGAISGADFSEEWGLIIIVAVMDIILLCLAMAKIMPSISSSFQLMRSGLKNRKIAKKESAKLKKLLKSEEPDVNKLQELRDKRVSESATKRNLHFCQLIENIAGKELLQDCLSKVREKQNVLDEMNDLENRILKIAERCKNAGDIKKCQYYLNILKTTKITTEITRLENDCEEQLLRRERESKAIRSWQKGVCCILIILITVFGMLYYQDTPYRELRSMIREQSLTAEMCDRNNQNSEESYYDYLTSKKGCDLIASELTKFHEDDDVIKAMWLLCIQPNRVNGFDLWASPSFIEWILKYVKNNGVRRVEEKIVTYTVDGYQITMDIYDDNKNDIRDVYHFMISDGKNNTAVDKWSRYNDTVPAIE